LLLATVSTLLILLEIWVLDDPDLRLARSVPGIAAGVSLGFLRRSPFAAYLVNSVSIVALIALGHPSDFYQWTNLIAIFVASRHVDLRRALLVLAIGLSGVSFYFLRFPDEGPPALVGVVLAVWAAAWFAGRAQSARDREVELKHDHDLTRAELAAQQAQLALEEERSRIARELHDIIGHSVNVMVVHAGAGRGALATNPDAAARSLETIAATGRKALSDLDRMLDVLHGQAERAPLPGLGQLDDLCRSVAGTGISVDLSITGDPGTVPSSLGVTIYRIVQEALTNVIKHARAEQVSVDVAIGDAVSVTVTDDGVGGAARPGRGLRGIEERVKLHGGTVSFREAPGRGFEVRCRLELKAQP
jgi:signal transduction histidine kinase